MPLSLFCVFAWLRCRCWDPGPVLQVPEFHRWQQPSEQEGHCQDPQKRKLGTAARGSSLALPDTKEEKEERNILYEVQWFFSCILSFRLGKASVVRHQHSSAKTPALLWSKFDPSFCRGAKCGSERLSERPSLTQQVRNSDEAWTEIIFLQTQTLSNRWTSCGKNGLFSWASGRKWLPCPTSHVARYGPQAALAKEIKA